MWIIKGFFMSLGMFSTIPAPKSWDDKYMPLVIPNMPLAGFFIGLIWFAAAAVLQMLSVPILLQSAAVMITPFLLSGFIHADGYMDTADALFSRRGMEEKRRILKDSHVGAFAVIAIVCLLLFQFCAVMTILSMQKPTVSFVFIPVMSRCAAGIAALNLPSVFDTGFGAAFKKNSKAKHSVFIIAVAALSIFTAWFFNSGTLIPVIAAALTGAITTAYLYKQFNGISGDLCGCTITVSELSALICMALV